MKVDSIAFVQDEAPNGTISKVVVSFIILNKCCFMWIGSDSAGPSMKNLSVGMNMQPSNTTGSGPLIQCLFDEGLQMGFDESDGDIGEGIARRLSGNIRVAELFTQIFVSYNLPRELSSSTNDTYKVSNIEKGIIDYFLKGN